MKATLCWILCFVGLLVCIGCGSGVRVGAASGSVVLAGKPLPSGRITFTNVDGSGRMDTADIENDGTYRFFVGLPVGTYRVTVDPPTPPASPEPWKIPRPVRGAPQAGGEAIHPLDSEGFKMFRNLSTSPLQVDLQPGKNTFNFSL